METTNWVQIDNKIQNLPVQNSVDFLSTMEQKLVFGKKFVARGKSCWRSEHQSRLPPLLQMLYVD